MLYSLYTDEEKLYVMARLPVTHRETAFDYCLGELVSQHGALILEEIVLECQMNGDSYYWIWDCKHYDHPEDMPKGIRIIPLSEQIEKSHQIHQEPFNCCSQWAV